MRAGRLRYCVEIRRPICSCANMFFGSFLRLCFSFVDYILHPFHPLFSTFRNCTVRRTGTHVIGMEESVCCPAGETHAHNFLGFIRVANIESGGGRVLPGCGLFFLHFLFVCFPSRMRVGAEGSRICVSNFNALLTIRGILFFSTLCFSILLFLVSYPVSTGIGRA